MKRQLADAHSVDSSDLQRRLKDVTDMLYLKQTQVQPGCWGLSHSCQQWCRPCWARCEGSFCGANGKL